MNQLTLSLRDLQFYSRHGLYPQENAVGGEFSVDLEIDYTPGCLLADENFSGLISYVDVYTIVKEEMGTPRQLLETVCGRIAQRIKERWPEIEEGVIKICKKNPPISNIIGGCAISLHF